MKLNLDKIASLKFQDKIILNGRTLYRAQEYPDFDSHKNTVDFLFYESWDKRKALLPKPNYVVRLHIRVRKTFKPDGWTTGEVQSYKKAELIDLGTGKEEIILSLT